MIEQKQPDALRLAEQLNCDFEYFLAHVAAELRRQHAEIEALQDDLAHKDDYAEQLGRELAKADSEAKELRAKLDELEKQRPCGYLPYGYVGRSAMVFGQPVPESVPIYLAAGAQPAATRADGMPASKDERRLRRLLASRVNMPCTYWDDGEASGHEHGISIDFMRDSVESIDEKLMNLGAERLKMQLASAAGARPVEPVQKLRPDFIAGYDAGMADAKRIQAHQPAPAVVVGPTNKVLWLLMAQYGLNMTVGQDMDNLLNFGRDVWNAALSTTQPAPAAVVGPSDLQLLKFYSVTTDAELIAAQAAHIEKLQAKLQQPHSFAPQRVREG